MNGRSRSDSPPWTLSLTWAAFLTLVFVVLYKGTNWYTSTRIDVGTMRFAWEEHIPLVSAFLIPYVSIDVLFFLAPFVCRTRSELLTHGKRILAATIIASLCFLLFPLSLMGSRPEVTGIAGPVFELLKAFDHPYNMCPSLHVTYAIILWLLFISHSQGRGRSVLHVWFATVIMSVLFVRQHHMIDVIGGAALALVVLYAIPSAETEAKLPSRGAGRADRKIAAWYAAGAALCMAVGALTALMAPIGFVLIWPAVSMAVVSAAYLRMGPRLFRKTDGRVGMEARLLLAPYLAGLGISRLYHRATSRGRTPGCEIAPGLMLGRGCSRREARALIEGGLAGVLDLTAEHSERPEFRQLAYRNVQILDLTLPSLEQLSEAVRAAEELMDQGPLYIHCGLGYARGALVAAAVVLDQGMAGGVEEACSMVTCARPGAVFKDEAAALLAHFMKQPAPALAPAPGPIADRAFAQATP